MAAEVIRAQRPFWMHQIVEYIIGVVLISFAFQSPAPAIQGAAGLLIMLNAAVTKGAAGAFAWIDRKVHKWIDVAIMVLLVVAAIQRWVDVDSTGRLVLPVMAFVLFFVWFHTDFEDREGRKARRAARARQSSEELGKRAGRMVGDGVNQVRRWQKRD